MSSILQLWWYQWRWSWLWPSWLCPFSGLCVALSITVYQTRSIAWSFTRNIAFSSASSAALSANSLLESALRADLGAELSSVLRAELWAQICSQIKEQIQACSNMSSDCYVSALSADPRHWYGFIWFWGRAEHWNRRRGTIHGSMITLYLTLYWYDMIPCVHPSRYCCNIHHHSRYQRK